MRTAQPIGGDHASGTRHKSSSGGSGRSCSTGLNASTGPNGGAFSCSARSFSVSDSLNEFRPLSDDVADTELDPADGWIRLSENVFTRPFDNGPEDTQ
ncbi:hypothetical protein BIU99_00230 [Plantibacter sp. MMLR14_011]|nr:hypothetical protein BIU99_00230 [Plantibacter sp. MMLR14_011]